VVGQHRSTQRSCRRGPTESEAKLRRRLRQIAKTHPRWGWKKAHEILLREGWALNTKRTRRLWRHEGLKRPQRCAKRRRLSRGTALRREATRPGEVWAVDFQFDETADYKRLKLTNIVDEFTREALATDVARSIDADGVVATLERLAKDRGAPVYVRFDHGPEFIAYAVADWCRFNGTDTIFIDPGSPWQNGWIESFNGRMRDEHLNGQVFDSLLEAQVLTEDWRIDYNNNRPHSAHGWLTPVEFVEAWLNHQPQEQLA
jgi:putative transposase